MIFAKHRNRSAPTVLVGLGAVELLLELAGQGAHEIVHVTHTVDEEYEPAGRDLCRRGFEAREISGKKQIRSKTQTCHSIVASWANMANSMYARESCRTWSCEHKRALGDEVSVHPKDSRTYATSSTARTHTNRDDVAVSAQIQGKVACGLCKAKCMHFGTPLVVSIESEMPIARRLYRLED